MSNKKQRGALTSEVQEIATTELGRHITQNELRLMPYIQYIVMNGGVLDHRFITRGDSESLDLWVVQGLINFNDGRVTVTKKLWDVMNQVLWVSYVNA